MKPKRSTKLPSGGVRQRIRNLNAAEALLGDVGPDPTTAQKRAEVRRARAIAEAQHGLEAAEAVAGVACAVTGQVSVNGLLSEILHRAVTALHAGRGILFLGRTLGAPLIPVRAVSVDGQELDTLGQVSRTLLQRSQDDDEPILTTDAQADSRFKDVPSVRAKGIRSVLCAKLTVRGDLVGAIYLDNLGAPNAFSTGDQMSLKLLASAVAAALQTVRFESELRLENERLKHQVRLKDRLPDLIANSPAMTALKEQIVLAAQIEVPVLLLAEPGTEVEAVARAIHAVGPRALRPFRVFDVGVCPRDLLEAHLFGHAGTVAGAQGTVGAFREADRGVLFLNEVTAMDAAAQARLHRVLEDRAVRPVRSREIIPVDVQVVVATSRDPRAEVRALRFDRDLLSGLNAMEVRIPPLRERPEDVPVLADYFLEKHRGVSDRTGPITFTPEALRYLENLPWAGNVTELEWLVQRVIARVKSGPVDTDLLRSLQAGHGPDDVSKPVSKKAAPGGTDPTAAIRSLSDMERDAIREALIRTKGNRSQTARLLGIRRNTLLRKIEYLDVSLEGIPNRRGRK